MCLEHRTCNKVQENSKTEVLELLPLTLQNVNAYYASTRPRSWSWDIPQPSILRSLRTLRNLLFCAHCASAHPALIVQG